ncbi:MAG: hypothetical protein ABJB74_10945 [Gemmatimonas sp.]
MSASLDALDEQAVVAHANSIAARAGTIDIMTNAFGSAHVKAKLLTEMSMDQFEAPREFHMNTHFTTVKAVARTW